MKENIYRNIYCGDVSTKNIGKEVRVAGWVEQKRNLGGLVFITLRDETGIVQLISEDISKFKDLTRESTITVSGVVRRRAEGMENKNMKTGEIEVLISSFQILDSRLTCFLSFLSFRMKNKLFSLNLINFLIIFYLEVK